MKVCYWMDTIAWGGAEHYLKVLGEETRSVGCEVDVVLPHQFNMVAIEKEFLEKDICVAKIEMRVDRFIKSFTEAFIQIVTSRPKVNHFVLCFPNLCQAAILASSILCVKTVVTEQSVPPYQYGGKKFRWLKRHLGRRVTVTTTISESNRENLIRYFDIPAHRVEVIHNGVDVSRITGFCRGDRDRFVNQYGLKGRVVLGVVSRISEQKGARLFPSIAESLCRKHKDLTILWAGDGPDKPRMEREVEKRGLEGRLILLGNIEFIPEFLSVIDIFVLLSKFEGLSFAVMEAMAAQRPVVAFDVSGNQDVVLHEETGFLVPPFDIHLFAERVSQLIRSQQLRERMGRRGFNCVQTRFPQDHMVEEFHRLYGLNRT